MFKSVKSFKFIKLLIFIAIIFVVVPFIVFAQSDCTTDIKKSGEPNICLQVKVGQLDRVTGIGHYIQNFYKFFVGAVITLAIFMIVVSGVRWLFAGGNSGRIGAAKKAIWSAVGAVVLVFISVALLRIINPDLLILDLPNLASVKRNLFLGEQKCVDLIGQKVIVNGVEVPVDGSPDLKYAFECGSTYSIVNSTNQCSGTGCMGDSTSGTGLCVPPGDCVYGSFILGSIQWEQNFYIDEVRLFAVCPNDGLYPTTIGLDISGERVQWYQMAVIQAQLTGGASGSYCFTGDRKPKGYLLGVDMNDVTWTLAPTIDDALILDRSCSRFVRKANTSELLDWSGGLVSPDTALITPQDLEAPFECNISITPTAQGVYTGGQPPVSNTRGLSFSGNKVQEQWDRGHAFVELKTLITDLSTNRIAVIVTSISDSNILHGACQPWNDPPGEFYGTSETTGHCQHSFHSAHYGGLDKPRGKRPTSFADVNAGGFSCAADLAPGTGATRVQLVGILNSMKASQTSTSGYQINLIKEESNPIDQSYHIHVSVKGCGVDGE